RWPTRERNGMVFVYYGAGAPEYEIPLLPEVGAEGWRPWSHRLITVATHPREIVENVVDVAHFEVVHATQPMGFENQFIDHMAAQRTQGVGARGRYAGDPYEVEAIYYGPGYQTTRMCARGVETRLVNAHTMIDEGHLHLRFGVLLRNRGDQVPSERF